ncbi:MAG: rhomboid family intramembrane serine protease [Termitinemataceae bacterium]|nr:MAG: rhomboid family intramembrane serine protease [Termitinemataceae bacterium]
MNILQRQFKYSFSNVTFYLIGINVLVYIAQKYLFPEITALFAMTPFMVFNGWVWQLFTYMFAHDPRSFSHIFFNMFALFMFGSQIERYIGSKEFLLYYLLTGTLAGIFSFVVYMAGGAYGVHLMGASGAIFAIQLAYACFFPKAVIYFWGIIPFRAPVLILLFTGIEIFDTVFRVQNGVAHLTHLAGMGFGALYFWVRWRANPIKLMLGYK